MSEEDNRYAEIEQRLIKNEYIYKHYYEQKDKLDAIIKKYKDVTEFDNSSVQSTGRVMVIRNFKKLIFFSLQQENSRIQLIANQDTENFEETLQLRRGDIVGFSGIVGRSRTGELSIFVRKLELLTPCLRTIPTDHFGLKGTELIYRKRYLDLLINMESREAFVMRSKCINFMRNYFNEHNFLEVETPIMDTSYGGAAARPFITYHNELKTNLYLRIAPELYLKKLVVGGLDRVFEVGKQFRNEGIDATHNPEFTSAEFYAAYEDYNSFMDLTENFLSGLFKSLKSEKITYDGKEINFKRPFRRIDLLSELNRCSGLNLDASRLDEQKGVMFEKCKELKLKIKEKTTAKLLDKLVGHYIEPQCVDPTFIINHPVVMSPLAKKHRENEFLTERFELFVNGQEIANAYTELNDPYDQKKRFIEQVQQKEEDDEAMEYDEGFVEALEFGLPPTAGLGFGIDRIVMLLTNSTSIRDVILFPTMK